MKLDLNENSTRAASPPPRARLAPLRAGLRYLTPALAILLVAALAVQLGRGKLWLVGPTGVWLLLGATLLSAGADLAIHHWSGLVGWVSRARQTSPATLGVALLTLFGLWTRLWGQRNGLPYVIPADESVIVDFGTRLLKTGNFDPQMYYYPSFYLYLEAVVGGAHFLWGSFTGLYSSLEDLPDRTFAITTAPQMYLWERSFTALVGAAAIPLAYGIVRRMWKDDRAAFLAAGFIACSALATEHSHYVTVDIPMATLALATLWPAWNIVEHGRRRDYILTGILAGLAFGTKWNSVTVLVLPLAAHLLRQLSSGPDRRWRRYFSAELWLAICTTGLTFLVSTPYILARIRGYDDAFATNISKYRLSTVGYATDYPWLGNLQVIWEDNFALAGLGLAGVVYLAIRRRRADWLLLSFPLVYLLSINGYRLIYPRNVLPLTFYFGLTAALMCQAVASWLTALIPLPPMSQPSRHRAAVALPVLFLILLMFRTVDSTFYANQFNDQPFSYARVEEWLKTVAGPGPLKLVEMRPQQWGDYPNLIARFPEGGANDFPLQYYRERGIQYVAINQDRVRGEANQGSYPELLGPGLVKQEFETRTQLKPGPAFTVVQTGVTPDTLKLQFPLRGDFGGKLQLLGFNTGKLKEGERVYLPPPGEARPRQALPAFKPGEVIGLSLYWQVRQPLVEDYTVFIHFQPLDQPPTNLASRDTPPLQGAYPTSRWKPGEIVTDNPNLALPAGIPPGDYRLVMGLYLNDGKFTPLPLADGAAEVELGKLKVTL